MYMGTWPLFELLIAGLRFKLLAGGLLCLYAEFASKYTHFTPAPHSFRLSPLTMSYMSLAACCSQSAQWSADISNKSQYAVSSLLAISLALSIWSSTPCWSRFAVTVIALLTLVRSRFRSSSDGILVADGFDCIGVLVSRIFNTFGALIIILSGYLFSNLAAVSSAIFEKCWFFFWNFVICYSQLNFIGFLKISMTLVNIGP